MSDMQTMGMGGGTYGHSQQGFPAALGYPQYDYMYQPEFVSGFLTNFQCNSIGEFLAMSNCANFQCGDVAHFKMLCEPEVFRLDNKDEDLKVQYYKGTTKDLRITEYLYCNLKIDDVDKRYWCDYEEVQRRYADMLGRKFALAADETLFHEMIMGSHCFNQGHAAGAQCRGYDLGTCQKPVPVTKDNIHEFISSMLGVIHEQCTDQDMQPFLVVPECWAHYMRLNEHLSSYYHAGNCLPCSPLITGVHPNEIMGFQLFTSDRLPKVMVNGKLAHYLMFGYRNATCFARGFEKFETVTMERTMGQFDRAIMSWGHGVLYPELIGHSVACLV